MSASSAEQLPVLPGEAELPYSDGVPMDSPIHRAQMELLIETVTPWVKPLDGYVGGDMFLYFSPQQVRKNDFVGPDVFVVLGADKRERNSWVVWEERLAPHLVIELLSASTRHIDLGSKKDIYEQQMRVSDYICYDPNEGDLYAWRLVAGRYQPVEPEPSGRVYCATVDLYLGRSKTTWREKTGWLRWFDSDGNELPTDGEAAEARAQQAIAFARRAQADWERAQEETQRAQDEAQRALDEAQRAQNEAQRAQDEALGERQRADALAAQVAALEARLAELS